MSTQEIPAIQDTPPLLLPLEPRERIQIVGSLVTRLAELSESPWPAVYVLGTSDRGEDQLEVSWRNRWTVIRALPGGRWWVNGWVSPAARGQVDVMLREGDLSVCWTALLWSVGLRGDS